MSSIVLIVNKDYFCSSYCLFIYRDPKTNLPYATLEAFKIIRERFVEQEFDKKNQKQLNMGDLFDSITGEGPLPKRPRTGAGIMDRPSDLRLGARFRRIPALEMLDRD